MNEKKSMIYKNTIANIIWNGIENFKFLHFIKVYSFKFRRNM